MTCINIDDIPLAVVSASKIDEVDETDETDETLPSDTGEKSANQDKYSFGSLFSKKYGDEADKDPHSFQ